MRMDAAWAGEPPDSVYPNVQRFVQSPVVYFISQAAWETFSLRDVQEISLFCY